eukprot:g4538.t1
MSDSARNDENGDSPALPSYMRGTLSSLRKNRERVSSSCTPRRLACGGKTTGCFDDYRTERDSSVGPLSRSKTMPNVATEDIPRYMRPTRSSSQKSVGEKYQIKPPRVPAAPETNNTPISKKDVKKAERRIQTSNVAMPAFVESLRNNVGPDISVTRTNLNNNNNNNNVMDVKVGKETLHGNNRFNSNGLKTATIKDNKNKRIHKDQKEQKSQNLRLVQPGDFSSPRNFPN